MKLHDLKPAPGSVKARTRVGRGIAAGKGKTAGRGTKGQKARAGGSIPAGFEGGQTPIHRRVPKLHGFKNRFRIEYEIVNVGRVSDYAEQGRFAEAEAAMAEAGLAVTVAKGTGKGAKGAPLTVNAELLHAVGLIRTLRRPVKLLGTGEVSRPLFVVADAFTKSARAKIEAAGGTAQVLEFPSQSMPALGVELKPARAARAAPAEPEPEAAPAAVPEPAAVPKAMRKAPAAEPVADAVAAPARPAKAVKAKVPPAKAPKVSASELAAESVAAVEAVAEPVEAPAAPAKRSRVRPAAESAE
jgi:large subunit ribosomal protein L15